MANLITRPTFTFNQGDPFNEEEESEYPIQVIYWDEDILTLKQEDNEVVIRKEYLKPLLKEILKHLPTAEKVLAK